MTAPLPSLFREPLLDLGKYEDPLFEGVLTPEAELGAPREGVDKMFLENAEEYYAKYQGYEYWRGLVDMMVGLTGVEDVSVVVEFGSGFGNATLPLLHKFPNAIVVATDISPNLLAILRRQLSVHGLSDRCAPVAMDAQKPYVHDNVADLVFGAAILHHLVDPASFVQRAMEILKPGGVAVFFEPLEGGYAMLRHLGHEVLAEAERRGERSTMMKITSDIVESYAPQILRDRYEGWRDRNDKWVFPRSMLDKIARGAGADLRIQPLHPTRGQFRAQFTYLLEEYGKASPAEYPQWAWDIFDRYDNDIFSPEMLTDLAFEGCLVFRKRAENSQHGAA